MNVMPYRWADSGPTDAHSWIIKPVLGLIPSDKKLKIADIGCGNGYMANLLATRSHSVSAIDSSADGIKIANESYPAVDFRRMSLYENLRDEVGSDFDIIVSCDVIEHLYDPRLFLRNAYGMLKTGGQLIITTPYHGYLKNLVMALTGKMDKHFTVTWDCGHIKFFWLKLSAIWSLSRSFAIYTSNLPDGFHFCGKA